MQPDRICVGAWSDDEIILQLPLVTIIDQIDAGIDIGVANAGKSG
jgi:hypothetical protein